jgi:predicted hotdog family 3-hydroxylacyl-ACP dehydratase
MPQTLYNITVGVDAPANAAWLTWLREEQLPELLRTGLLLAARILKVSSEHCATPTYAIQLVCESVSQCEKFKQLYAAGFEAAQNTRFPGQVHGLHTQLEVVDEIFAAH